jgi:hypothetical protein
MPWPADDAGAAELPIAVTRYQQPHATARLPIRGGGRTQGGKLYLVGIYKPAGPVVACAGPFPTEQAQEEALRSFPLREC